ncbi:MAG: MATE family efflux transporter [Clostridia bacterium]|nr:MATE family efflux transporter [Clostridia bacterium]
MLKNKNLYHTLTVIMALALPTMLEQLMQTAVQYIDTAMVGTLGTHATAAVGSTVTINWLISSTVSALGVGFLSHLARSLGAKEEAKAKRIAMQATLCCLIAGIFFTLVTTLLSPFVPVFLQVDPEIHSLTSTYFLILYLPMLFRSATIIFGTLLRASGDSKTPMYAGILTNIINIILNFFLIFPSQVVNIAGLSIFIPRASLGVIGAALASAISFVIGGLYITVAFFNHKTISPRKLPFKFDKAILTPCLKTAFPNMLQRFATSLGYVVFASLINSLGQISTAATTVANTVESLFYIPAYGMQTAAATLSGNAAGAGNRKKMKEYTSLILITEFSLMVISGAMLFIFAPNLSSLFSEDTKVIALSSFILRMVALSEPFYGVFIIIEGILQGVGETVYPLKINLLGMWIIRNAGTFICIHVFSLGLVAAWGCMIAHNMLSFILFVIYYLKGNWNPLNERK